MAGRLFLLERGGEESVGSGARLSERRKSLACAVSARDHNSDTMQKCIALALAALPFVAAVPSPPLL